MATRPLLELGPDLWGTFGSGLFGSGIFGEGGTGGEADVTGPCSSIIIRRGLSADGVVENLEPGVCTVVLHDQSLNPLTYEHSRVGRPLRVLCEETTGDAVDRTPVFTGTIDDVSLVIDPDGRMTLVVTALDAVSVLANTPYATAHAGTFEQRVTPVLEAAGVTYAVHDDTPDELIPGTLPTNQSSALGQLVLARDTMHGFVFVDRENTVQAYANHLRDYGAAAPTFGDGSVVGLDYVDVRPSFDSSQVLNVLTIETLTGSDPELDTFTDDDSVAAWGAQRQTVTVNDGDAEDHSLIFRARLDEPGLTIKSVRVNATVIDALPDVAALELYQPVRVVRDDLVDVEVQILSIEHTITPRIGDPRGKWMTTITTRRRELLALRWDDVPGSITWDDVPADLTWRTAIGWHP